jgi:hypothetical protein
LAVETVKPRSEKPIGEEKRYLSHMTNLPIMILGVVVLVIVVVWAIWYELTHSKGKRKG